MSNSASIKQSFGVVTLEPAEPGGETRRIVVRRMRHGAQRQFLKKFAKIVEGIVKARAAAGDKPEETPSIMKVIIANLPAVVAQSEELANELCLSSTGLTLEQFDDLDGLAALEVLRMSLEINFDEALKNCCAAIVESLLGLMAANTLTTTSSANSTPT